MTTDIEISRSGRIQVLRFARPQKKNALTGAMYAALSDALEAGDADADIAAHVFFGSGGIFSAGNDLGDFLKTAQGAGGLGEDVLRFIRLLPKIKKPMLAGVDGKAVGIGATLLFHCDLVYVTPASELSTPFLDLGLVPEAGSSLLAPRLMGHQLAFELLVLGAPFSAARTLSCGLANALVDPQSLEAVVLDAAARLAAKPPEALALARRLLKGDVSDTSGRIEQEALAFEKRLHAPESREAFEAFFAKRPPNYAKTAQ